MDIGAHARERLGRFAYGAQSLQALSAEGLVRRKKIQGWARCNLLTGLLEA